LCLSEIIIQKIRASGPLSFHEFMEMALYYPEQGYYTSPGEKLGKEGDYYTSCFLSSLFGSLIAKQLEEMWRLLGSKEFTIVEYGAGTGRLCRDILHRLGRNEQLYEKLHYCIIERSAAMREKEKAIANEKITWCQSIRDLPAFTGCVLSNEVVDNFPVHQVMMQEALMELYVDYRNGFEEIWQPASLPVKQYLEQLQIVLPKGFRTEINLQAVQWITDIAAAIKEGFVLTIDYGYPSADLYADKRNSGTLVCYHKHRMNHSPYTNIGEQDITSHVNFSALRHWGLKNGLTCSGFTDQALFLQSLGMTDQLRKMEEEKENLVSAQQKGIMLHTFLMDMGRKFKVLVQQKGKGLFPLSGLQLAGVNRYQLE
jgi:SAM-dependent MidA family methyltransferase